MKLSDLLKPRIKRRFQPIDYIQPDTAGFKVPTPPAFDPNGTFSSPTPPRPKPKPSELIQDLRSEMPEPPIQDYEHFMDTNLYDGMVKQSRKGENYFTIDCESKLDEIYFEEFQKWEVWIKAQGIDVTLHKGFGDDKAILLYWGED